VPRFLEVHFWFALIFITDDKQLLNVLPIELTLIGRQTFDLHTDTDFDPDTQTDRQTDRQINTTSQSTSV